VRRAEAGYARHVSILRGGALPVELRSYFQITAAEARDGTDLPSRRQGIVIIGPRREPFARRSTSAARLLEVLKAFTRHLAYLAHPFTTNAEVVTAGKSIERHVISRVGSTGLYAMIV